MGKRRVPENNVVKKIDLQQTNWVYSLKEPSGQWYADLLNSCKYKFLNGFTDGAFLHKNAHFSLSFHSFLQIHFIHTVNILLFEFCKHHMKSACVWDEDLREQGFDCCCSTCCWPLDGAAACILLLISSVCYGAHMLDIWDDCFSVYWQIKTEYLERPHGMKHLMCCTMNTMWKRQWLIVTAQSHHSMLGGSGEITCVQ